MFAEIKNKSGELQGLNGSQAKLKNQFSYEQLQDASLWELFKSGNKQAFILIYDRHFEDLYVFAQQFTADRELIKDVIQDLFVRLFETGERLGRTDSIRFYLLKCLKRDVIRSVKKSARASLIKNKGLGFQFEESAEDIILNRQIREESVNEIRNAANNLKNRQREIVFYYFFEGFTTHQIKDLMQMGSVQAVHNLLSKAIKKLRVSLEHRKNDISFPL